jgi:hypothetical protein
MALLLPIAARLSGETRRENPPGCPPEAIRSESRVMLALSGVSAAVLGIAKLILLYLLSIM